MECPYDNEECPHSGRIPYTPQCVECNRFELGMKLADIDNKIEKLEKLIAKEEQ